MYLQNWAIYDVLVLVNIINISAPWSIRGLESIGAMPFPPHGTDKYGETDNPDRKRVKAIQYRCHVYIYLIYIYTHKTVMCNYIYIHMKSSLSNME